MQHSGQDAALALLCEAPDQLDCALMQEQYHASVLVPAARPGLQLMSLRMLQVFSAIVDEFGSTLNSTVETGCMTSILNYMAVQPGTGTHAPFNSWFYWCASWQLPGPVQVSAAWGLLGRAC